MVPRTRRYGWLVVAVSFWMGIVVLLPYARAQEWPGAQLPYFFFSLLCHQLPARSFSWMDSSLPVCHRCLGLYLGFWLGLVTIPFLAGLGKRLLQRPRAMGLFFVPLCIDLLSDNTAISRLGTGVIAGFPLALFVWVAVEQFQLRRACRLVLSGKPL